MVLQSYDGVIRIAPALPSTWDVSLSGFLTVGAFEVDADVVGGQVQTVALHSLRGQRCRIHNPWPGKLVDVLWDGARVPFTETNGVIEFATEPGATYEIAAHGRKPRPFSLANGSPAEPMPYWGPAYLGEVPPEKRIAVWLGLPPHTG
jgi:hypothetical protein